MVAELEVFWTENSIQEFNQENIRELLIENYRLVYQVKSTSQECMKRNYMDSLAAVKNNATVEVETQRPSKALLISKAQNQIEEIEIRLKSSTSPSETKKLRDLINEREQFIAKRRNLKFS